MHFPEAAHWVLQEHEIDEILLRLCEFSWRLSFRCRRLALA